jgi:hypothetical protein
MVSQCANPRCGEPFIYYSHGKLFSVPRSTVASTHATIEHFWLCETCAQSMAIEVRHGGNPLLISRASVRNTLQMEYQL